MRYVRLPLSISLLLMLVFLAACSPLSNPLATPTPTAKPTQPPTPTATPASAASDTCPAPLDTEPGCYTPHAFRVAYGVEPLIQQGYTGKGQTVVDIVSFGSPTLQKDLDVYDKQFGLPPIKLQIISPLNEPISDPDNQQGGWAEETTLDVEIIHAIAPDANIVVLTSPVAETEGTIGLPEFLKLEQYVIDHKLGNIVSQSWGASELTLQSNIDPAGPQQIKQWDTFYQQATIQHAMTYLSSSGDNGSTDYIDLHAKQLAHVQTTSFPCDEPWVTAVGGTQLQHNGTTFNESVWNAGGGASGGGFSRFFSTPSYQQTLPTSAKNQLNNHRGVPDVAAAGDPSTALANYVNGHWTLIGGTSAAAPVWAGIMAIANQMAGHPLGFINPALYKLANSSTYTTDFHDITNGDNTNHDANVPGYPATQGWDPVTGLGTPNAAKLIPDLIAAMK